MRSSVEPKTGDLVTGRPVERLATMGVYASVA
jgi:hypothetical protein